MGSSTHLNNIDSRAVHEAAVGMQVARPEPDDEHRGCLLGLPVPRLRCGAFHGCRVTASPGEAAYSVQDPHRVRRQFSAVCQPLRSRPGLAVPSSNWEGWSRAVCSFARRTDDLCTLFPFREPVALRSPMIGHLRVPVGGQYGGREQTHTSVHTLMHYNERRLPCASVPCTSRLRRRRPANVFCPSAV